MTTAPHGITNWWAVEAMIASYNHVYHVVYGTNYEDLGVIGVSVYGSAPIAYFQNEFLALSSDPRAVVDAVRIYPQDPGAKHILDAFHDSPTAGPLIRAYEALGYEAVKSGLILSRDLNASLRPNSYHVRQIHTLRELELANQSLGDEGERIPPETLQQDHIKSFVVDVNAQPVGWAQLVTLHPRFAYLNQVYVMNNFRRRQLGSALVMRAQVEAAVLGKQRMVLVPSDMAVRVYARLDYQPAAYFTAFRPREAEQA